MERTVLGIAMAALDEMATESAGQRDYTFNILYRVHSSICIGMHSERTISDIVNHFHIVEHASDAN